MHRHPLLSSQSFPSLALRKVNCAQGLPFSLNLTRDLPIIRLNFYIYNMWIRINVSMSQGAVVRKFGHYLESRTGSQGFRSGSGHKGGGREVPT